MWYLLFFISYSIFKNKNLRVLSLFLFAIYIYNSNIFEQFTILDFQFKLHAFSFVAGIVLAEYKEKISLKIILPLSAIIFGLALKNLFTEFTMISYEVSCISFGLLAISLFAVLNLQTKILSYFGELSYEMYLFEGVLLGVSYNENLIINAVMFVFFTTATATMFKKGLTASKLRYASLLDKTARI